MCTWENGKMQARGTIEKASVVCLYPVVLETKEEKAVRWREII